MTCYFFRKFYAPMNCVEQYCRYPGFQDPEILETQDTRILRSQDSDILGFLNPDDSGFRNPRILESQDLRILVSQVSRISGSQDPGILVHELKESIITQTAPVGGNINDRRSISLNQHQSASININQHQSASIKIISNNHHTEGSLLELWQIGSLYGAIWARGTESHSSIPEALWLSHAGQKHPPLEP